jgi:ring-1,2-phenylacetyl-CoA epoxidase subunit PaaC
MAEAGIAPLASSLQTAWRSRVQETLQAAKLEAPPAGWPQRGGKVGRHTEHLDYLLAEMQVLPRTYPGARW